MRLRSVAVAAATAVALSGVSAPVAFAAPAKKPAAVKAAVKSKPAPKLARVTKPAKKLTPVSTTYSGALTAVDSEARTLSLLVSGGNNKASHGLVETVVVSQSAVVTRDGVAALLSDFQVGDLVELKGTRTGAAPAVVDRVSYTSPVVEAPVEAPVEPAPSEPVV